MSERLPSSLPAVTPRQREVARLIAEGCTNEQIAEQLGVSLAGAKYHVAELIGRLGVESREQVAVWYRAEPQRTEGGWRERLRAFFGLPVVAVGLGGAVVGAVVVVAVMSVMDRQAAAPVQASPTVEALVEEIVPPTPVLASPPVEPLPLAQHGDFRAYTESELLAAGFVNTGQFVSIPNTPFPVTESSCRSMWTLVRLARDGYVRHQSGIAGAGKGSSEWRGTGNHELTINIDGLELHLWLTPAIGEQGAPSTQMIRTAETMFIYRGDTGAAGDDPSEMDPQVQLTLRDQWHARYPVILDSGGRLWVRPAPVPEGVVARDTGEAITVEGAEVFGPLAPWTGSNLSWTHCAGGVCSGQIHTDTDTIEDGGLRALFDGVARCSDDDRSSVELSGGGLTLRFTATQQRNELGGLLDEQEMFSCELPEEGREVAAGEPLAAFWLWGVTAYGDDGAPLSVVVDDQLLYVGEVEVAVRGCPCGW